MRSEPLTVAIMDGVDATAIDLLRPLVPENRMRVLVAKSPAQARTLLESANLLFVKRFRIGREELAVCRRLRGVQKLGVVTDNVDTELLRNAGVPVRTCLLPSSIAVADHALALMLAATRNLKSGMQAMHHASDRKSVVTSETVIAYNWANLTGKMLAGRRLGLVGFGEIGNQVAKRAKAFGMHVTYSKRSRLPSQLEQRFHVKYQELENLLAESDVVSIHVPHTPETSKMFDRAKFEVLKPGAVIVNTSRGGVIDEHALADAVNAGRIAGVGLDVYAVEPLPLDSPLLRLSCGVLTPHMAGAGPEAMAAMLERLLRSWAHGA